MASLKEIKRLKTLAKKYRLDHSDIADKYTLTRLASIYNGIGPDGFPGWLRGLITALHPTLAPVAFIHDIEWHETDGTEESFTASNNRFKANGYLAAQASFAWWDPRRYIVMNQARRFGNYCQAFGWKAWLP